MGRDVGRDVAQLVLDILDALNRSNLVADLGDVRLLANNKDARKAVLNMVAGLSNLLTETVPQVKSSDETWMVQGGAPDLSNEALKMPCPPPGVEGVAFGGATSKALGAEPRIDQLRSSFDESASCVTVPMAPAAQVPDPRIAPELPADLSVSRRIESSTNASTPAIGATLPPTAATRASATTVSNVQPTPVSTPPPPRTMPTPMNLQSRSSVAFSLPNAKAGQPYRARLTTANGGPQIRFRQLRLSAGLNLALDGATGEVFGIPTIDGEQRIDFQWSTDSQIWHTGECSFFVNPDPRSLWKKIEPPTDGLFFKENTAGQSMAGNGLRISAGSRRGRSHEHDGKFRDDDFFMDHDPDSSWSLMIVCDGAGSAKFSRRGSKIACDSAGAQLMASLRSEVGQRMNATLTRWDTDPSAAQEIGVEFHGLFHEAAKTAVMNIEAEAASMQATPRDFSTTLLAAAVRKSGGDTFVATFWMGDGAIGVYGPVGKIRLMGAPDNGEFAGQTRFLDRAAITDVNFSKRLRVGQYSDATSVMLMTDGVSDPFFETDQALADGERWDKLWEAVSPKLDDPSPHERLVDWLDFFTPGHHDDRTIAVLW